MTNSVSFRLFRVCSFDFRVQKYILMRSGACFWLRMYEIPCFSSEKWHFQAKFSYLWVILTVFCGGVEYSTGPKMFKICKVTFDVYFDEKIILICYLVPKICVIKNHSQTRLMSTLTQYGFNMCHKGQFGANCVFSKCINWLNLTLLSN